MRVIDFIIHCELIYFLTQYNKPDYKLDYHGSKSYDLITSSITPKLCIEDPGFSDISALVRNGQSKTPSLEDEFQTFCGHRVQQVCVPGVRNTSLEQNRFSDENVQ